MQKEINKTEKTNTAKFVSMLLVGLMMILILSGVAWGTTAFAEGDTNPIYAVLNAGYFDENNVSSDGSKAIRISDRYNSQFVGTESGVLKMTDSTVGMSTAAFLSAPMSQTSGFSTAFQINMGRHNSTVADGWTFVAAAASNKVGLGGNGMGYDGIPNSVAVEYDLYDNKPPDGSKNLHLGLGKNGVPHNDKDGSDARTNITKGNTSVSYNIYGWIEYEAANTKLYVRLAFDSTIRPATPTVVYDIDLAQYTGPEYHIGFTFATGWYKVAMSINKWIVLNQYLPGGASFVNDYIEDNTHPAIPQLTIENGILSVTGGEDTEGGSGLAKLQYIYGGEWTDYTDPVDISSIDTEEMPCAAGARSIDNAGNISQTDFESIESGHGEHMFISGNGTKEHPFKVTEQNQIEHIAAHIGTDIFYDLNSNLIYPDDLVYKIEYNSGNNVDGAAPPGLKVAGCSINLMGGIFTKSGHLQTGWATTEGGTKAYELGGTYSADSDIALYPVLTPLSSVFTITYNKGSNGTGEIASGVKAAGTDCTLSSSKFSRSGYIQTGWATTDGGTKAYELGGTYAADAILNLYPVWTLAAPVIASGSGNISAVYNAQNKTLSVTVNPISDIITFSYQWYKSDGSDGWTLLTGKTSASLTLVNVADSGDYKVIVTASDGSQTSAATEREFTVSITAKAITVTANAGSKTYGATTFANTGYTVETGGLINEDTLSGAASYTTTATQFSTVGGSYTISVSGLSNSNYSITFATGTMTVNPKAITVTANAGSKTYGATTFANTGYTVETGGLINEDALSGTASYTTTATQFSTVGGSYTISVSGLSNSNYSITFATGTMTVNKKQIDLNDVIGITKTYDGTNTVSYDFSTIISNVKVNNDVFSITGTYASVNAGSGISVSFAINGINSSNYELINHTGKTGIITAKTITLSSAGTLTKVYDGTTAYNVTLALTTNYTITGLIGTDTVSITFTSVTFNNANAASATTVTAAYSAITSGNYALTAGSLTYTATITPKTITLSSAGALTKVYDGTTAYNVTLALNTNYTIIGLIGTDSVTITFTSVTFNDANVASATTVTAAYSAITSGNYALTAGSLTYTATITRATAATPPTNAGSKVYSGQIQTASVSAGTGYTIKTNAGGTNGGEYDVVLELDGNHQWAADDIADKTIKFEIMPKTITLSSAGTLTKVYDGTTAYSGTLALTTNYTITGLIGTDTVSITFTSVTFNNENVASATSVTAVYSAITSGNYALTAGSLTYTATITRATAATPPTNAGSKVYNGQEQTATISAGTGYTIKTNAGGTNGGEYDVVLELNPNYQWAADDIANKTIKFEITPVTLTLSSAGTLTKVYDGTTAYSGTLALTTNYTITGLIGTDTLSITFTSVTFNSANVASATTVTAAYSAITSGNYALTAGSLTYTATITRATAVMPPTNAGSKVYSGSTQTATISAGTGYTIKTNAGGTNVGEYDVVLELNPNYQWAADDIADKTIRFTITKGSQNAPALSASNIMPDSIILAAVQGAEYSIGGENWQDSNIFAWLSASTRYTFYIRMKATSNFNESEYAASAFSTSAATVPPVEETTYEISGIVTDANDDPVAGALVYIVKGRDFFGSAVTDSSGRFAISNLPDGVYNVVALFDGKTATVAVTVSGGNAFVTIRIHDLNVSSKLEVKEGAPNVVVGGLDEIAGADGFLTEAEKDSLSAGGNADGGSAELKLTVEASTVQISGEQGKTIGFVVDITVTKTILDSSGGIVDQYNLPTLSGLISVIIPLGEAYQSKQNYVVYRMHGDELQIITTAPNIDGECFMLTADGKFIVVYTKNFSSYAIGFDGETGGNGSGNNKPDLWWLWFLIGCIIGSAGWTVLWQMSLKSKVIWEAK